jgi:hypothetical protein
LTVFELRGHLTYLAVRIEYGVPGFLPYNGGVPWSEPGANGEVPAVPRLSMANDKSWFGVVLEYARDECSFAGRVAFVLGMLLLLATIVTFERVRFLLGLDLLLMAFPMRICPSIVGP